MANGYLIAELLAAHGLLQAVGSVVDKETPSAKVSNLMAVQQPLTDLGIPFNSKIANELMTETKGTAVSLCYQLKLGLENASNGGARPVVRRGQAEPVLLGSTLKSSRHILSKHEKMQSEHFESLVKQQVQDPKQLAQALSLAKYTEHMIAQQQRDEELDQLRAEQYTAMVAQRRQLELAKLHEGKRLMSEWQADGYAKHAQNVSRRRDDEKAKLRFELTCRSKKAAIIARQDEAAKQDMLAGVDDFESTLRRLQSDTDASNDGESGADGAMRVEVGAAEHLMKLESLLPSSKVMDSEAKAYLGRLRTKRLEEEAARKEREMRRRKVMLEQDAAQAALEERRKEDLILSKLARQCAEERKIGEQLWIARKEKEVMRANRELRDQQLTAAARQAELQRREADRARGAQAREEYRARLERERLRAEENERARQAVLSAKHEKTCRKIAEQLVALAGRVVDFRATTQPLMPAKVLRDWTNLFKVGMPLDAAIDVDSPHVEELPADELKETNASEVLDDAELDTYLAATADWSVESLSKSRAPEGITGDLVEDDTLAPAPAEAGCAQTGRMVLEFIEACTPPPPVHTGADLPASFVKVVILGRPFSGKSFQARQLADVHRLQVIMVQEVVEAALAAAMRYDEALQGAGDATGDPKIYEAPSTLELARSASAALNATDPKTGAPMPGAIPDEVLVGLIIKAIQAVDPVSYSGFVLDGFPRTATQAAMLEKALTGYEPPPKEPPKKGSKVAPPPEVEEAPKAPHLPGLDCALRLDLPEEMARRRALGRRLDPQTGIIYHLEFQPPQEVEDELGPTFNGINGRLVDVEGAADQEASLPTALAAYAAEEAALEEWFSSLGVLALVPAEPSVDSVADAANAALAEKLALKDQRIVAKQDFDAATAEAAAATDVETDVMDENTPADPADTELTPESAPLANTALPAALPAEAHQTLFAQWSAIEGAYVHSTCVALARMRSLQWSALQRVCSSRSEFVALLTAPDAREQEVHDAQSLFNSMPAELRLTDSGKAELHAVVNDLQETLYTLSDERRAAAEKLMSAIADDGWLPAHALQITLAVLSLAQAEVDRYHATCGLLHSYCSLSSKCNLQIALPPRVEVGLVDAVDMYVPSPSESGSAEAAPAGKAAKGAAPAKGAPPAGTSPQAALASMLASVVTSLGDAMEEDNSPPAVDETATAEAQLKAEWTATLHAALVGERCKLRRRLASMLRHGCSAFDALASETGEMFVQLDSWLGMRQTSENEAVSSLVKMMKIAIEGESTLPQALQLQGNSLVIDETLLMQPPPPPLPIPPPQESPKADRFTVAQLRGLMAKLGAASDGAFLDPTSFTEVLCRLGAAGFDATSAPLPEMWWPLGPPQYAKVSALFSPPGAPARLAWREVIFALAALPPPSEDDLVNMLIAAARLLGRNDLLSASAQQEEVVMEKTEPAAAPVATARVSLVLTREQFAELPLWCDSLLDSSDGGGYDMITAVRNLLFDTLADATTGSVDLQQLLLYACDSISKAFAVLGFHTQCNLSLDGIYELLHREQARTAVELPEHLDPYSRAALTRLFTDLKLSTTERAPYATIVSHPNGVAMLGGCTAYMIKDVYGKVSEVTAAAGRSLTIAR